MTPKVYSMRVFCFFCLILVAGGCALFGDRAETSTVQPAKTVSELEEETAKTKQPESAAAQTAEAIKVVLEAPVPVIQTVLDTSVVQAVLNKVPIILPQPNLVTKATFYVSPQGSDKWSGRLAAPNEEGTDGPLATFKGARNAVRRLKQTQGLSEPVTVLFRKGTYYISEPLEFTFEDSGSHLTPITYAAYPNEKVMISGGRPVENWSELDQLWVADVPEVRDGTFDYGALWVDGERQPIAQMPNENYFYTDGIAKPMNLPEGDEVEDGQYWGFRYRPGDIGQWENLGQAEFLIFHAWDTSLMKMRFIDREDRTIYFQKKTKWEYERWGRGQRYVIRNILPALDQPGEWVLDRQAGKLYYWPKPEDQIELSQCVVPLTETLIKIEGGLEDGREVQHLVFRGFEFAHTNHRFDPAGEVGEQAGIPAPGTIHLKKSRYITIENCTIARTGGFGVWIDGQSTDNRIFQNEFFDLGVGGVWIGGYTVPVNEMLDPTKVASRNRVENNFIHGTGKVKPQGPGILITHADYTTVAHNEISDGYHNGIQIGWTWGYGEHLTSHNLIEYNHIHHLGQGLLSDFGGVYTLGRQVGTIIRNNLIHDCYAYKYGGWGLYADQGSSEILFEKNIVFNTDAGGFHQHYGRENRVRNNILAFANQEELRLTRAEEHLDLVFENNIVLSQDGLMANEGWVQAELWSRNNLYWNYGEKDLDFGGLSYSRWQSTGNDINSQVADPRFYNATALDFRLRPESIVHAMGFEAIDASTIGLYGPGSWINAPQKVDYRAVEVPPVPISDLDAIHDDFEETAVGEFPASADLYGIGAPAMIQVVNEKAASGNHSLKFSDGPGAHEYYEPEMSYSFNFTTGEAVCRYKVWLGEGAILRNDLRDERGHLGIGPQLIFMETGELAVDEKVLLKLPHGTWIGIEIRTGVGKFSDGTFDLEVEVPGRSPAVFTGLPNIQNSFRQLQTVFFMSIGERTAEFYLDDLHIFRESDTLSDGMNN